MNTQMDGPYTLRKAERVGVSRNGNPTFRVYFDNIGGSFLTSTDAGVAYAIPNWKAGDKVVIKLTKAERISYGWRVDIINGRAIRRHN
jgi:hypothetical protein